jgi:hypothetical protein
MADATHARVTLHALIVLAVLPAMSACWVGADCRETIHRTLEVPSPPTPQMQLLIDSCMADQSACTNLCAAVIDQQDSDIQPTSCTVEFGTDKIVVNVAFDVFSNETNNCSEPPPFADGGLVPQTNGR